MLTSQLSFAAQPAVARLLVCDSRLHAMFPNLGCITVSGHNNMQAYDYDAIMFSFIDNL